MLLQRLVQMPGVFTFFAKGEEKPLAHHASKRKPFEVYAGAEYSPYFCNFRTADNAGSKQGTLDAETMTLIGDELFRLAFSEDHLRYVTGIPNAGHPIADAVVAAGKSYRVNVVHVMFDKHEGSDGRYFTCNDPDSATRIQAVFDDVVTLADVKVRFMKALPCKPPLYVLVDRQEGGMEILKAMGYEARAAHSLDAVIAECLEQGRIDLETADRVLTYAARRRKLISMHMDEIVADLKQEVP